MIDYTLYLCTDTNLVKPCNIAKCVEQAILGGVTIVQVREKNKSDEEFINIAKEVQQITKKYKVPLIINDRVDIAKLIDADGVHLGQNDTSCKIARNILGNKIIGVTVTTLEQAEKAARDGATYLGLGAMFLSRTKENADIVNRKDFIEIMNNKKLPIVLIGGINETTIPQFKGYNIDGYAMIRSILGNDNIKTTTIKLKRIILENKEEL